VIQIALDQGHHHLPDPDQLLVQLLLDRRLWADI